MLKPCSNFGIPVYIADIPSIIVEFHVGTTQAILPGSLYPYGLGVGAFISCKPLFCCPFQCIDFRD